MVHKCVVLQVSLYSRIYGIVNIHGSFMTFISFKHIHMHSHIFLLHSQSVTVLVMTNVTNNAHTRGGQNAQNEFCNNYHGVHITT